MPDRPTAEELVLAAKEHLEQHVLPSLKDPKLKYQTLVAAHVLGIVTRELAHGERLAREELASLRWLEGAPSDELPTTRDAVEEEILRRTSALCEAIRHDGAGERPEVRAHVRRAVEAKLAVANPAYKSL